jgi:diaminohydroxyphosphoribosylaminopyrimidine deaminase/5-amino-6-(5-phosphoribosylamino)uracil reductase
VAPEAPSDRVAALNDAGAETIVATDLDSALRDLARREVTSLFLEGGRTLASTFLSAGQIDESRTFIAPMLIGGSEKGGVEAGRLVALDSSVERVGDDTLITARFKEW